MAVLEISTHDYGPHNERLVNKIANGLNTNYRMREEYVDRNNSLAFAGELFYISNVYSVDFILRVFQQKK